VRPIENGALKKPMHCVVIHVSAWKTAHTSKRIECTECAIRCQTGQCDKSATREFFSAGQHDSLFTPAINFRCLWKTLRIDASGDIASASGSKYSLILQYRNSPLLRRCSSRERFQAAF
jgi:hypothetical protein